MIRRAYVHVTGPPGGGKTVLVERILESFDGLVHVARCARVDELREPEETNPSGDPELRRYRAAGADGRCCYRFPRGSSTVDDFFSTDLMADYSEAVILEGDLPVPYVDVTVYVAPTLPEGESLLVRQLRDRAREAREQAEERKRLLSTPGGADRVFKQLLGPEGLLAFRPGSKGWNALRDGLLPKLLEMKRESAKGLEQGPTEHWAIAQGYPGIEGAPVVVVNTRGQGERGVAEQMVLDLKRIRKDPEVFEDILGPCGSRIPITAVAADLADPRDPGTRKILGRIKRSMKGGLLGG